MTGIISSLPEYHALARARVEARWPGYGQPEDFGYDFRDWVSPYTKGAQATNGLAFVLQDWASAEHLIGGPRADVQQHGRTPGLLTNRRLEDLLQRVFGCRLADVYATNAFPFIKQGGMSSGLPIRHVVRAAELFLREELRLARPTLVLALGGPSHVALRRLGIPSVPLPHPAARIGSLAAHEQAWRLALDAGAV